MAESFKNVYRYIRGVQPESAGPGQPGAKEQRSFSSLASQNNNFGALLSGKKTPQEVTDAAAQQSGTADREAADKAQSEEARKQAIDGLKQIGKSALMGVGGIAVATVASKKFSESMLASQEHLKRFNGQIGIAFARLRQQDIRRSRDSGQRTSGTTATLAEAVNGMRDSIQPLKDTATNVLNVLATGLSRVVKFGADILNVLNFIALLFPKGAPKLGPWQQGIKDMAERFDKQKKQNQFRHPTPSGPPGGAKGGGV